MSGAPRTPPPGDDGRQRSFPLSSILEEAAERSASTVRSAEIQFENVIAAQRLGAGLDTTTAPPREGSQTTDQGAIPAPGAVRQISEEREQALREMHISRASIERTNELLLAKAEMALRNSYPSRTH